MSTLKSLGKQAIERRKITLDYHCWMDETEKLADFAIVISPSTLPPLVANGAYADIGLTLLTTFIQGGLVGQTYIVSFIVTTNLGQIKRDDLQIRVT